MKHPANITEFVTCTFHASSQMRLNRAANESAGGSSSSMKSKHKQGRESRHSNHTNALPEAVAVFDLPEPSAGLQLQQQLLTKQYCAAMTCHSN